MYFRALSQTAMSLEATLNGGSDVFNKKVFIYSFLIFLVFLFVECVTSAC
jgi:hypothetical protein